MFTFFVYILLSAAVCLLKVEYSQLSTVYGAMWQIQTILQHIHFSSCYAQDLLDLHLLASTFPIQMLEYLG